MDGIPRLLSWAVFFACGGGMIWSLSTTVDMWVGMVAGASMFGIVAMVLQSKHRDDLQNKATQAAADAVRSRFMDDEDDEEVSHGPRN